MKKYLLTLNCLFFSVFLMAQTDSVLIDFNNLNLGDLNGQANFITIDHWSGNQDFKVSPVVGNTNTPDGSNGIYYNGNGGGFGRSATLKDFGDFEFDLSNGGIVELQVDMHSNWWWMNIGLGFDADGDGMIANGLDATEDDDGGVQIGLSNQSTHRFMTPAGDEFELASLPNGGGGWLRYRMLLNLSANGGSGQAALFVKAPPFDGDWIAIAEVQGLDLGLTPGSGDKRDPATWVGLYLHAQGGTAFFDNIIIRKVPDSGLTPQFINFESIGKQLTTNAPFELNASADSGLPITFEVLEGPATVNGNTITLTGDEGIVKIQASQDGDGTNWEAAPPVVNEFQVVDPSLYFPELIVRNPVDQNTVMMPELNAFLLKASTSVEHDDVLGIEEVVFMIDGNILDGKDWGTGYYTAWWTPPAYGNYILTVESKSTGGPVTTEIIDFEVVNMTEDMTVTVIEDLRAGVADTNIVFPSFVGGFNNLKLILQYNCPSEGCEPWDRINQQTAQGPTGDWIDFMRYITPYGVACGDEYDITDYASVFQGLVRMRLPYEWRSVITIRVEYTAGTPNFKYSWVDNVWNSTFPFGQIGNEQPVPIKNMDLTAGQESAHLNIINSGHGWGDNNTNNAAEFYEATHTVKVNDNVVYAHHLWEDCNPNPTGCQPQNGTWFHNRAGWCPGALVPIAQFDLTDYVGNTFDLHYQFFPAYVDLCSSSNPNCVDGVTCPDCSDGFNPHLVIDAHLITQGNQPLEKTITNVENEFLDLGIEISPNPSDGILNISTNDGFGEAIISVVNNLGQQVYSSFWNSNFEDRMVLDLSNIPTGIYWVNIQTEKGFSTEKVVIR
ncbi:MAG: peptide-N-glycosidase F-related protein [Saprospiraceae bacterium]|nr:peptide-N-glycosidase F-related protein [Saprospiraceae bacterium]